MHTLKKKQGLFFWHVDPTNPPCSSSISQTHLYSLSVDATHHPQPTPPLPWALATLLPLLPLCSLTCLHRVNIRGKRQLLLSPASPSRTPWSVFGLCLSAGWSMRPRPGRGSRRESSRKRKRQNMTARAWRDSGIQLDRIRWRIDGIEWGRRWESSRDVTWRRTPHLGF